MKWSWKQIYLLHKEESKELAVSIFQVLVISVVAIVVYKAVECSLGM